jgi:hypothetical protein
VHVHSIPISRAVWEANYRLITKTTVAMYGDGLAPGAAMRVTVLYMRDTAKLMDETIGGGNFQTHAAALLAECWRLTNVMMLSSAGTWQMVPFQELLDRKQLDPDILSEVQNAIAFFTLASWFHRDKERQDIYSLMKAYGAQIISLDATGYMNSLQTSTATVSSGATATASSTTH